MFSVERTKVAILAVAIASVASCPPVVAAEGEEKTDKQEEEQPVSDLQLKSDIEPAQADGTVKDSKPKGNEKSKNTDLPEPDKKYFLSWFKLFFHKLYFARSVTDVAPYYSFRIQKELRGITPALDRMRLKKFKKYYMAAPRVDQINLHPSKHSADVAISGRLLVYGRKGYGHAIFRMVRNGGAWRIDSTALRAKQDVKRIKIF